MWTTVIQASRMLHFTEYDNPSLAASIAEDITMIKYSSDGTKNQALDVLLGAPTTIGRLYRAAVDGTGKNATLEGARPFGYNANSQYRFQY